MWHLGAGESEITCFACAQLYAVYLQVNNPIKTPKIFLATVFFFGSSYIFSYCSRLGTYKHNVLVFMNGLIKTGALWLLKILRLG